MNLNDRMNVAGLAALFAFTLLLCGCQQKIPPAPTVEGRSESQMDQEYRSILAEVGLYGGGTPTPPAQIEADKYGQVLLLTAGHGSPEMLARLLAARGDVNLSESYEGRTLLHAAAAGLNAANCNLLLERGLEPNARDNLGRTPLHLVVAQPQGEVLARLLLARGAHADIRDEQGLTPLLSAAPSSIKLLVDKGSDLAARDAQGNSVLHWAVRRRGYEAAEILIALEVALDLRDNGGKTALHLAVELNDPRMAQLLLKAGAKSDIGDSGGETPLQLAEKSRDVKMRQAFGL